MSRTTATPIGYFGKLPSRGDFVKASDNPALLKILDDWLAQAMDLLSADARWKLTYDALPPMQFAFIGPRRGRAIAGHIAASSDASSRRFPFLMMSTMEVEQPAAFVANSPLVLSRLWNRFEALSNDLRGPEAGSALQAASHASIDLDLRAAAYEAAFNDFLDMQTVGELDALLAPTGFTGTAIFGSRSLSKSRAVRSGLAVRVRPGAISYSTTNCVSLAGACIRRTTRSA